MAYQLIVGFRSNTPHSTCMQLHDQFGARLVERIPEINAHIVSVPSQQLRSCLSSYSSCNHVRFAERNGTFQVQPIARKTANRQRNPNVNLIPNDPLFSRQWGLKKVSAPQAWDRARTNPVRLAILDTGIDRKHPDLARLIVLNRNFSSSSTTDDLSGHGTHVAGIAAAITNNRTGGAGMSFNAARLMNVKVLGDDGRGPFSNVAKGIIYAAQRGADVINMSLSSPDPSKMIRDAVAYAANKGVLLVGAAGNGSGQTRYFPAAYPQVISVAATNQNDEKASFSNYGASWVNVPAPGSGILSTLPTYRNRIGDRDYGTLSGTSQAAPFVSGLAALIKATYPRLNRVQIRRAIESGTDRVPGVGTLYRFGRINAVKALRSARTRA